MKSLVCFVYLLVFFPLWSPPFFLFQEGLVRGNREKGRLLISIVLSVCIMVCICRHIFAYTSTLKTEATSQIYPSDFMSHPISLELWKLPIWRVTFLLLSLAPGLKALTGSLVWCHLTIPASASWEQGQCLSRSLVCFLCLEQCQTPSRHSVDIC